MNTKKLADLIRKKIRDDFKEVHLSQNLMDTITVEKADYGYVVKIPAKMYDLALYKKDKVIVYNGNGSYASQVDDTGGFSGKHKDYIERAVKEAITEWLNDGGYTAEVNEK